MTLIIVILYAIFSAFASLAPPNYSRSSLFYDRICRIASKKCAKNTCRRHFSLLFIMIHWNKNAKSAEEASIYLSDILASHFTKGNEWFDDIDFAFDSQ